MTCSKLASGCALAHALAMAAPSSLANTDAHTQPMVCCNAGCVLQLNQRATGQQQHSMWHSSKALAYPAILCLHRAVAHDKVAKRHNYQVQGRGTGQCAAPWRAHAVSTLQPDKCLKSNSHPTLQMDMCTVPIRGVYVCHQPEKQG